MLDPRTTKRLMVYGGSFDPPHRAHIELPFAAAKALGADGVLFVPAGQPPHKTDRVVSAAADRLAMLRLALGDRGDAAICEYEVKRNGPSYTVQTLEHLRVELPGVELRLLIGADMAASFYTWREPRKILEMAEPAVMMRDPFDVAGMLAKLPAGLTEAERECWRGWVVGVPRVDVSSTRLRELLREGKYDAAEVRGAMSGDVVEYVRRRGLYAVR